MRCAPACLGKTRFVLKKKNKRVFVLGFEPRISRVLGERHDQARPYEHGEAFNEDRTRDLALTKRMLCQLSYEGGTAALRPKRP